MNPEEQNLSVSSFVQSNDQASSMQIRLVTEEHLKRIELLLKGMKQEIIENPDGVGVKLVKIGNPYANAEGIQGIMKWVYGIINPHFVQGNFPVKKGFSQRYEDFIKYFRIDFGCDLILNCVDWEIPDKKIDGLIDCIMSEIEGFSSRLIGNKERDSYGLTMKTVDSSSVQSKGMKLFKA